MFVVCSVGIVLSDEPDHSRMLVLPGVSVCVCVCLCDFETSTVGCCVREYEKEEGDQGQEGDKHVTYLYTKPIS